MKSNKIYLALDAGTTTVKALAFDNSLSLLARAEQQLNKQFPSPGWVEQNPKEILQASVTVLKKTIKQLPSSSKIVLGITNQRETIIAWDKQTGKSIYPAIVWEDKRTKQICAKLAKQAILIKRLTGLSLSPYFSASKIFWLLQHSTKAKQLLKLNRLAVGTVDSWLIFNFTKHHLTDRTNASRTLLYDVKKQQWSKKLCGLFNIPLSILPSVQSSSSSFGYTKPKLFGKKIPIYAVAGDQQASMAAAYPNDTKATFGTGLFVNQRTNKKFKLYKDWYTTLLPDNSYCLEAKVEGIGKKISAYLNNKQRLNKVIRAIANQAVRLIHSLPRRPKFLIIDGGATRNPILQQQLEKQLGIPVSVLSPYDGAALGIAKLLSQKVQ
ncbi:MAG: FGGY family carbohydrate kinase [bacterium]